MKNQSGRLRQMIFIIALIVLQIGQVWAQSEIVVEDPSSQTIQTIKGKVTSGTDNQPLQGVNVIIKGTIKGVITNADGSYQITAASNSIIVFSFIGFQPQEIPVKGKNTIDVTLMENISQLNEVVVTALNINRTKSSLGYSVTSIKGDNLNQAKENNIINTLSGKVAGLQISKSASGVDGSTRVILRGVASLTGDNRPLIVVDGIPINASHGGADRWGRNPDGGDALSDINPEDIENISVLKGAGAAAAYGSRGAMGVILITTKKGTGTKGLGVTLTSSYTNDSPLLYPDFQNEYGHGAYGTYPKTLPDEGFPWGWSWGPKMEGQMLPNFYGSTSPYTPQKNNYKEFFQSGHSFTNTVALDGGNETSSVRASFTNQNSSGIIPTNDLKRQTIFLRGFAKMKDMIELDGKVTYIHSNVDNRPGLSEGATNPGYFLSIMPRNIVSSDLKNHTVDENGIEQYWTSDPNTGNPYWQLYNAKNNDQKHHFQGVFSAKIIFNPQLNLLIRSGMDFINGASHAQVKRGSRANYPNETGFVYNSMTNNLEWNSDFLANYSIKVQKDIDLTFSLGGNYRYNTYKYIAQSGSDLRINDFYNINNCASYSTAEDFSEKAVVSAYALGSVSYKNYLYFDYTLRNDWSSTLPAKNNSYFYHSENLSFLFTNAFKIKSDILCSGKLRGSYARVGKDTGPYQTQQYYSVAMTQHPYPMGNFGSGLPSYNLQPEITSSWEVGTNLVMLKNILTLDLTYYNNTSNNQIMGIPLPPTSGFTNMMVNAAHLRNRGYEVQLDAKIFQGKSITWDITATWSKNISNVVSLYQDMESIILEDSWAATIQAKPGDEYGAIYAWDYKRDSYGRKLIDDNGFAQLGEYKKMGSINPDWIGGISNRVSYKNITLSFLIDIRKGGQESSVGKMYRALFGTSLESLEGRDEWYSTHDPAYQYSVPLSGVEPKGFVESGINETTGQPNTVPVDPIYRWYNLFAKNIGTDWIVDATNVRLRELVLAYTMPKDLLSKTPFTDVQISLVGRNLFFFYNAMNDVDPESGYNSGNTGGGFEHCAIPTLRSLGFNIRIGF
ncbi:MAG: SusC/RagA family TonB-linked outer membrane protein [Bacteroidales bacterium]|nr:SusC/RagA family TonB-linked outer membrane protein [Bacteroidales bacterium]